MGFYTSLLERLEADRNFCSYKNTSAIVVVEMGIEVVVVVVVVLVVVVIAAAVVI